MSDKTTQMSERQIGFMVGFAFAVGSVGLASLAVWLPNPQLHVATKAAPATARGRYAAMVEDVPGWTRDRVRQRHDGDVTVCGTVRNGRLVEITMVSTRNTSRGLGTQVDWYHDGGVYSGEDITNTDEILSRVCPR